jgi:thymidylate kinase
MSLIYITGVPGTGKSTVQKELVRQGFEAYDIDQARFGGPTNLVTGEPVPMPSIESRSAEWFKRHEWRVSRYAVEELKQDAAGRVVYLCGTATTDHLIWDLFDRVLFLEVDEETLRERLAGREDNDFGKTDDELRMILERYRDTQERVKKLGVITIDATGDLTATTDQIKQFHKNYTK